MDTLRWVGWMFARLVALAVLIVSGWMFIINLVDVSYQGWILAWILLSGVAGVVGGTLYLLSIDGPNRYRTRTRRSLGWAAMLVAMLLPSSLSFFLLPTLAVLVPTLFIAHSPRGEPVTSS